MIDRDEDQREPWQAEPEPAENPFDVNAPDSGRYILDEHGEPVVCDNLLEWGRWYERNERHVGQTLISDRIWVSTVFLGLDHDWSRHVGRPHQPILWETMSFWHGEYLKPETVTYELMGETHSWQRARPVVEIPENQERYRSRAAAVKGHARHVAIAERLLQELDAKHGANYGKKP